MPVVLLTLPYHLRIYLLKDEDVLRSEFMAELRIPAVQLLSEEPINGWFELSTSKEAGDEEELTAKRHRDKQRGRRRHKQVQGREGRGGGERKVEGEQAMAAQRPDQAVPGAEEGERQGEGGGEEVMRGAKRRSWLSRCFGRCCTARPETCEAPVAAQSRAAKEMMKKKHRVGRGGNRKPMIRLGVRFTAVAAERGYGRGLWGGTGGEVEALHGVASAYFPMRKGCWVTLYQDSHVWGQFTPRIEMEGGEMYEPQRGWEDMCR